MEDTKGKNRDHPIRNAKKLFNEKFKDEFQVFAYPKKP
jgi:hypothetical protein